jgi:hypothetical protein
MISKYLWMTGSLIFVFLGVLHLVYTFFTTWLLPRNKSAIEEMKKTYPVLTKQTTVWKAWVGFNASHSIGAIFFGFVNIVWSGFYFTLLQNSILLSGITILVSLAYLLLAEKYWFNIPFTGILVATACFLMAIIV